jgi:mannosyltransferase
MSREADHSAVSDRRFLWAICGLVFAVLWIRPIASSLWIDEFGTWWTIEGGASQAVDRAWTYQGQSPFYYLIVWGTRHVLGSSEWALRAPSIVFGTVAIVLLFRLVRRLVDAEAARIAAIVAVAWPIVAFSAVDARPYALAMMLAIAATLAFVRWLDRDRWWLGVAYVVLVAATVYAHHLFGLVVIAHAAYAVARMRDRSTTVTVPRLIAAAVGVVVLVAPMTAELADLWNRRDTIDLPNGLSVDWVVTLLLPAAMVGGLVLGGALAALNGGRLTTRLGISGPDLVLVVAWIVGPTIVLIALTVVTPLGLQGRYSLVWAPAAVILVALAIRAFEPASARRVVVLTLAVLSVVAIGSPDHLGDWRGGMAAVSERATDRSVVLLQSGYVESMQLDWYDDAERVSYLGAPTSYYPVPGQVVVLPVDVTPDPTFSRNRIETVASGADQVFLLTSSTWMATWVGEVLRDEGFETEQVVAGIPFVYRYTPT